MRRLLLIVGVFAMLYVRERRLWVWLAPKDGGSQAAMALSSNRKTLDADYEFDMIVYATGFDAITGAFDRIDFEDIFYVIRIVSHSRQAIKSYFALFEKLNARLTIFERR